MKVALSEIAEVKLGRQRSPKNHVGDSMRPYLRAANVSWSGLLLDDVKEMNFTDAEMDTFRLRPGDLLLNEASGSPSEVGKPALWSGDIADCGFQNTLLRVRAGNRVDPRYLLHFFRHEAVAGAFAKGSRGAGINHLGRAALASWPVPLPVLAEQRRIAAILDQADALRVCRRRSLALVESLARSLFCEMFGGGEFPVLPIGQVIADQLIGLDRAASRQGEDREFEYVKMDAISRSGRLDLSSLTKVDASAAEVAKYSLAQGDLLLNTRNSRDLVGKTAVYRGEPRLFNNNIMRIRFDGRVLPDFVHQYLWTREGRQQLDARKSGTTSVFAMYARSFASLELPVPPLESQIRYADLIAQVEAQRAAAQRSLTSLDELFASLQSRAFSGRL